MLKQIRKRNGSIEKFDPHKLIKWSEWASKGLNGKVDWFCVAMDAFSSLQKDDVVDSSKLQEALIASCLAKGSWSYYLMAGRLYGPHLQKQIFPNGIPNLKTHLEKMYSLGLLKRFNYTEEQIDEISNFIDHNRDYFLAEFQLRYINSKYALQNRVTKEVYETPQLTYIRLALSFAEREPEELKVQRVKEYYEFLSNQILGVSTPDYVHTGTGKSGTASCCLFVADDNKDSIKAVLDIAYHMSAEAAGIGGLMMIRTEGDPVRGGSIQHKGMMSYQRSLGTITKTNTQGGRGSSVTSYCSVYHPEVTLLAQAQGVRTTEDKKLRDLHFCIMYNKFFAKKVQNKEDIFQFTIFSAPDLWQAQFSGDEKLFEDLYNKYEQDPNFKKTYINSVELLVLIMKQEIEIGTLYGVFIDEINRHTPFLETIYSSNLCIEIVEPTYPYRHSKYLYVDGDTGSIKFKATNLSNEEVIKTIPYSDPVWLNINDKQKVTYAGSLKITDNITISKTESPLKVTDILESNPTSEVALCNLASINVGLIGDDEEKYEKAAYLALKKIDKSIYTTEYALANVGYTAKNRMNAGVGVVGLAYHLAKKGLKYGTLEGRNEIHRVFERHSYYLIKASLKISKERGLAPWIYKTKWPDGWLPIDTYKKAVDELVTVEYQYDWEKLRSEIIANRGIGHSCLVSLMPTESSSKPLGMPNGPYPPRDIELNKTDASIVVEWCAKDSDIYDYQIAYDIDNLEMFKDYAVMQKWCDHSISADGYRNRTKNIYINTSTMVEEFLTRCKYGVKSKYYQNSLLNAEEAEEIIGVTEDTNNTNIETMSSVIDNNMQNTVNCESGVCKL